MTKNNNKPLIIIGIILLNVLVVFMTVQAILGSGNQTINEARAFAEQQLCSKSIEKYNEVLAKKDKLDTRLEMVDVYRLGLEIGEFTNVYDVDTFLTDSVKMYSKEPKIYEAACALMIDYQQYEECANLLMQARDTNIESDLIAQYTEQVRYQNQMNFSMYSTIYPESNGTIMVETEEGKYSYLNTQMSALFKGEFSYATTFTEDYAFVQTTEYDGTVKSFVLDKSAVRQCYFENVTDSTGVGMAKGSDNKDVYLVACKVGDTYKYFHIDGTEAFGEYAYAGRFRNGVAAVKNTDDTWNIINGQGEVIGDSFTDVVLNDNFVCSARGVILAQKDGKYNLYSYDKVKKIGDFSCDAAKPVIGPEYFAFQNNGLWGYADLEGKVIVEPKYEDAKSFSNNIAAVKSGDTWSYINPNGDVVLSDEYEDALYLSDTGILFVKSKGYWCYLTFYYTGA